MALFRRPTKLVDNSKPSGGKHEKKTNQCKKTWGTCDVRSNDKKANPNEQTLPHICGNYGDHRVHECLVCPGHSV
jgi:hypothetical protein